MRNRFKAIIALLIFIVCSCTPQEQTITPILELKIPDTELSSKSDSQFIYLTCADSWTLSLDFGTDQEAWAKINGKNTLTGKGGSTSIVLSWEANPDTKTRSFTITLRSPGNPTQTVPMTQLPKGSSGGAGGEGGSTGGTTSTTGAKWLELPATDNPNLIFITHDMNHGGTRMRNWSCYYDKNAKLSHWVAYPLNNSLRGTGGRTDDWNYDPKISKNDQPRLFSAYAGGFDRGHQLPSADRLNKEANKTTFYFTNMTPQAGVLNQQAWASLEGMVREWAGGLDTLYVVTGADVSNVTSVAKDNYGVDCMVPNGYYKALLGYKKGGSIGNTTAGYIGIAFYFEHRKYSNTASVIMGQKMTIDALETKLGIDFFVNLPDKIGSSIAAKVESNIDSWWK